VVDGDDRLGGARSSVAYRLGLFAALWLRLPTETASGDSDSKNHAVEALQGVYSHGAMRASLATVPPGTRRGIVVGELLYVGAEAFGRGRAVAAGQRAASRGSAGPGRVGARAPRRQVSNGPTAPHGARRYGDGQLAAFMAWVRRDSTASGHACAGSRSPATPPLQDRVDLLAHAVAGASAVNS